MARRRDGGRDIPPPGVPVRLVERRGHVQCDGGANDLPAWAPVRARPLEPQ
jgi:hypothetical protein